MNDKLNYSKKLFSLLATTSTIMLGFLCIANNYALDLYSVIFLLSVVVPASLSLGFIGYTIGKIFDENKNKSFMNVISDAPKADFNSQAYQIPSLFSSEAQSDMNDGENNG